MYAISTVDARKLSAVVDSMQAAFATGESLEKSPLLGAPVPSRPPAQANPTKGKLGTGPTRQPESSDDIKARINVRLRDQIRQGLVDVEVDPRGLVVSIREAGSFATGSAELSLVAQRLLVEVATALGEVGNAVRVEGHTDDVPIHTEKFASNWELSTARATRVVAFLVTKGIEPTRLSAAGYGEFHPRVSNTSYAARARNRRVDVIVLNPMTTALEEPASVTAPDSAVPQ
jgi:chemotaxis protein MotB